MQNKTIRMLFLGDISGQPGVSMFCKWVPRLKEKHKIDAVVVNGENASKNGKGISPELVGQLQEAGADVITSGNHVWGNKKIYGYFESGTGRPGNGILLRPANYPAGCPGKGHIFIDVKGCLVAVISLLGRVFMREDLDCPFRTIQSLLSLCESKTKIIFVDFHAEATSEKRAMFYFLDGKVSGLYGTHTHVQTADEQISELGTSYITDLGFSGSRDSALGVEYEIILDRFLTQMPAHFKIEKKGPMVMTGVWVEVDTQTGKAVKFERISFIDEELVI